jgi:hypothetical protein
LGVCAGALAGVLNSALLVLQMDRFVVRRPRARWFVFGAASRFALIGLVFLLTYQILHAQAVTFVVGLALVPLMGVPYGLLVLSREATQ